MPPGWDNVLRHELANPAVLATAFKFEVNRRQVTGKPLVGLRFLDAATNFRANRFMLPRGEQVSLNNNDPLLDFMKCLADKLIYGWFMKCTEQGLAMTTNKFREYGGFPNIVIMEDMELVWKLRKDALAGAGRIKVLNHAIACTSPKRFEKNGVFRTILLRHLILLAYMYLHVSPQKLYRWYYHDGPRILPWFRL